MEKDIPIAIVIVLQEWKFGCEARKVSHVVNNPALGWVHHRIGAVHPFMPEVIPEPSQLATTQDGLWRASQLPRRDSVSWKNARHV